MADGEGPLKLAPLKSALQYDDGMDDAGGVEVANASQKASLRVLLLEAMPIGEPSEDS